MAAGLGFKTFNTGDVLSAADVNGYLMQGVLVFADATARDAAITSPQEGQFAYLKDTNVTTYYTGSAWANLDTTGMTNPMTTTGDTIYSSSGSTPARLGIGTAGQVLTVNSGATAPEWKTPAAGGSFAGCSLVDANQQTITNNTYTALTWDTEDFDTDGFHSTSSNTSRITIPSGKGGYYLFTGQVGWDDNTTGVRILKLYKNGTEVPRTGYLEPNAQYPTMSMTTILSLVATDYVEMYVYQNSGGNRTAYKGTARYGWFNAQYLGA